MSSKWRRFEVLLRLQFNEGQDVPREWLAEAVLGVANHFGTASYCWPVADLVKHRSLSVGGSRGAKWKAETN